MSLEKVKAALEKVKKPRIKKDREETIEEDVGGSVSEAYCVGTSDGYKEGQYELAQKLLKMLE